MFPLTGLFFRTRPTNHRVSPQSWRVGFRGVGGGSGAAIQLSDEGPSGEGYRGWGYRERPRLLPRAQPTKGDGLRLSRRDFRVVGEKLGDGAVGRGGDAREQVAQIGEGIEAVLFGAGDEAV